MTKETEPSSNAEGGGVADMQVTDVYAKALEACATKIEVQTLQVSVWQLLLVIAYLIQVHQWRYSADGQSVSIVVDVSDNGIATLWQPDPGTGAPLSPHDCKRVAGQAIKRIAEDLITRFLRAKS